MEVIIAHCNPKRPSRIGLYMQEVLDCEVLETTSELVFFRPTRHTTHELLHTLFKHPNMHRSVHSYFLVKHQSTSREEMVEKIKQEVEQLDIEDKRIRVKVYPGKMEEEILEGLWNAGLDLHPRQFSHFVSIVHHNGTYYHSLQPK